MDRTDARLLRAIAQGDQAAFTRFYDRHADRVYRYCLARLRDPHRAADAAQETMVAVWRSAARFRGEGSPLAWLFGIASRKVRDVWRRAARRSQPAAAAVRAREGRSPEPAGGQMAVRPELLGGPDPALEQVEDRLDLLEGLARLPPEQQEAVLLVYYAGLSVQEVAAATGVPEGTVKSRLYHGRRALARAVETGR